MQPQAYFPNPQDGSPPHEVDLSGVLVADGATRNELLLMRAMEKAPRGSLFRWPTSTKPLRFGALPPEFNNYFGEPVAINCDVRSPSFVGSGPLSQIQLDPGTAGFQTTAGISDYISTFRNFNIHGPGRGATSDGRNEDGTWSKDYGKYVHHGINGMNQFIAEDVNVRHITGHGIKVFGFPDMFATGLPIPVRGTLDKSFFFRPDPEYGGIIAEARPGWGVRVQGLETVIGGVSGVSNYLYLVPKAGLTSGDGIELLVIPQGGPMIADNVDIVRGNIEFIGGSGVYVQGSDANLLSISRTTFREIGYHPVTDISFLGIWPEKLHATATGLNFPGDASVWSFCTLLDSAPTDWEDCYTEEGTGQVFVAAKAKVTGGKYFAGVTGPGAHDINGQLENITAGGLRFDKRGVSIVDGSTQPVRLRLQANGMPGWWHGDERDGQAPHALLRYVRPGDTITDDDGRPVRENAARSGVEVPALYVGGVGVFSAPTLQAHLDTLGSSPARTGDLLAISVKTNLPRQYLCQEGGDAATCRFQPTVAGVGPVADRPDPAQLTRHDVSYEWLSTATGTKSAFVGGEWVAPQPPATLGPLTTEFIPDSSPLLRYSEGHWNPNQVSADAPYRNQDVAKRSYLEGEGTIDYYFSSEGQGDESVALYFPLDGNAQFAIYLNDELVISRQAANTPAVSHGNRVVQHFRPADFYRGGELAADPSCVLQPAPGPNHLRLLSYNPAGNDSSLYFDGAYRATRGQSLPAPILR